MFAKPTKSARPGRVLPAVIILVACGCAQLKDATNNLTDVADELEDVAVQRQERKQQVVEDFARRRDNTQYRASLACWERGDARGCESQLIDLLNRNPDHLAARLALADLRLERGKPAAAEQQYRELIARHPHQALVHYNYGLFLDVTGRTDEAAEHFGRAAEIEPDHPTFAALAAPSDPPATPAVSATAASRTAVPDDPNLAVVAAANLLQAGKADLALQLAAAASQRHPGNVRLRHAVASAQYESGDPKSAQVTLQQALSLDKGNALTYFLLGYALQAQGDDEAAQRHFAKARQLDPRLASQR
jgi:predicted Zn-dependent protease